MVRVETKVGSYDAGQVVMTTDDDVTTVNIRWPFDRATDEWITLKLELGNEDIRRALASNARTIGKNDYLTLRDERDATVLLSAQGKNTLGPVYVDCRLSEEDATSLRQHLSSI